MIQKGGFVVDSIETSKLAPKKLDENQQLKKTVNLKNSPTSTP